MPTGQKFFMHLVKWLVVAATTATALQLHVRLANMRNYGVNLSLFVTAPIHHIGLIRIILVF